MTTILFWALHQNMLLGEPASDSLLRPKGRPDLAWGFMGVSVLFFLAGLIAEVALRILLDEVLERHVAGVRLLVALSPVLTAAILFVPFGMALPAAAVGDAYGLRVTLARARRTGGSVIGGLVIGPGLLIVAALLTLSGLLLWVVLLMGESIGELPVSPWLARSLAFAFFCTFMLLVSSLAAAVLCRAYRRVAPPGVAALLVPDGALRGAPVTA
jgi:hypothetical protein